MARRLDDWIKAYLQYADHTEAPQSFHFWTAISTLAGAIRRHVWIDQVYFDWVPNFYIVFVAPPGIVTKSTTMNLGMSMLKEIDEVVMGPNALTWQALVSSMSNAVKLVEEPGKPPVPMSAITCAASELGTFLDPQDRNLIDVLVDLWDGRLDKWQKVTKASGDDTIVNPWINFIACTTPSWIAENMPEYMIGGGFTSRTIFVYEDKKRKFVAYPEDQVESEEKVRALREILVDDLRHISEEIVGPFTLSREAKEWGKVWYAKHYSNSEIEDPTNRLGGWVARKQSHIHKLAIILSIARKDERVISLEELQLAEKFVTAIEGSHQKVFSRISTPEVQCANQIKELMSGLPELSVEALLKMLFHQYSFNIVKLGIQHAEQAGYIKRKVKNGKPYITSNKT